MKADSAFFDLAAGGMKVDFARVVGEIKPGAHLLALSSIATHHCHTIQVEDAGFEVRDTVAWVFDSGGQTPEMLMVTVARKPLEGTVAANVLAHGTGGINVDGCRVSGAYETRDRDTSGGASMFGMGAGGGAFVPTEGRWPANLIHDGSDEVVGLFPQTGKATPSKGHFRNGNTVGDERTSTSAGLYGDGAWIAGSQHNDAGSAARFFYSAPCLDNLITYLLKLITQPNGTVLTNCNKEKLPNDYNYIGQEL